MRLIFFGASAIFWLLLGLLAAAPGIVGGDSPELTAAAFHLGSAHAPGYPLFITLGHLFQLLPVGTIAFRLTFFSILAQTISFLILTKTLVDLSTQPSPFGFGFEGTQGDFPVRAVREIGRVRGTITFDVLCIAILSASLVFAGQLVFRQLVSPEVFSLHLLFVSILLRFVLFPSSSNFLLASFLTGVALSHQHLTLLMVPALGWAYRSYFKNPNRFIWALTLFIFGLSSYLVLTLRAVQDPLVNWGNPTNFHQLLYHISRTQYGGDITKGSLLNGFLDFYLYSKDFLLESFGMGFLLLVLGIWKSRQTFKPEYFIGGFCLFILLPFLIRAPFDPESNHVNEAFLPPAILWLSPLMLKGLEWVLELIGKIKKMAVVLLLLFVVGLAGFSSIRHDASRNFAVEDVGRGILLQMPTHSALYSEGDAVTFPLAYLNLVEKLRPDLAIFDRTGGLFKNLYHLLDRHGITPAQQVMVEKEYELNQHPAAVFYTENTDAPGRPLTMTGLLFQVTEEDKTIQPGSMLWNLFRVPRISLNHDYFSRETACRYYLFKVPFDLDIQKNLSLGMEDLRISKELGFDNYRLLLNAGLAESNHDWTDQAALTFEQATQLNPGYFLSWYDRGVVAEKQNHYTQAVVLFQRAVKLAPDYAEAHQHLGYLYSQSMRMDEAIQEWESVINLAPLYAGAYRNLGYAAMEQRPAYAAKMFLDYLALTPNAPDRSNIETWLASHHRQ